MNTILKYLDIFKTVIRNNLVSEFLYRSNFMALTIADLIYTLTELFFFDVIYSNTTIINGWTRPQTFFFLGVFICADTLFTSFFQRSFWQFPQLINRGDLDILLTKPANTALLTVTRYFNLTQLMNMGIGIWVITRFGPDAGFEGGLQWFTVLAWITIGLVTQVLLRFSFVVWSFWLERGFSVSQLYYQFYSLATKPDALYPNVIRYAIKTVLPFAFIGSVPSQAILGKTEPMDFVFLVGSLVGYSFLCYFLWHRGLRRYQSASS